MRLSRTAALLSVLLLVAGLLSGTTVKTVKVDCSKGDSLQKALEEKADELIIELRGICHEEVVIQRDRVTIRGADPFSDGVRGIDPESPWTAAVLVREARHVRFENLSFSNGFNGLRASNSRRLVEAINCRFTDNFRHGLLAVGSGVVIQDGYFSGNGGGGLGASESSTVSCEGCIIESNPGPDEGVGALTDIGSSLILTQNSHVSGQFAVRASRNSWVRVNSSVLDGTADALNILNGSEGLVTNSQFSGAIFVNRNSLLHLDTTQQTGEPSELHLVFDSSSLILRGTPDSPTTLLGNLLIGDLSRGTMRNVNSIQGDLSCFDGRLADFVCDDPNQVTGNTNGCSSCVKPPACESTTDQDYILSGGPNPGHGIFVDDILEVYLNGVQITEFSQGGGCCTPADPVHFIADTGDQLRIVARDANNCYSLGPLFVQKANGSCLTELTPGLAGPDCGNEPPGQTFFDETFTLP